jgi:hypothetical protein
MFIVIDGGASHAMREGMPPRKKGYDDGASHTMRGGGSHRGTWPERGVSSSSSKSGGSNNKMTITTTTKATIAAEVEGLVAEGTPSR